MSRFEMDHDVERVLAFMQRNVRASKLYDVAHAVAQLSDFIWVECADRRKDPNESGTFVPFRFIAGNDEFRASAIPDSLESPLDASAHRPFDPPVPTGQILHDDHNEPQ